MPELPRYLRRMAIWVWILQALLVLMFLWVREFRAAFVVAANAMSAAVIFLVAARDWRRR